MKKSLLSIISLVILSFLFSTDSYANANQATNLLAGESLRVLQQNQATIYTTNATDGDPETNIMMRLRTTQVYSPTAAIEISYTFTSPVNIKQLRLDATISNNALNLMFLTTNTNVYLDLDPGTYNLNNAIDIDIDSVTGFTIIPENQAALGIIREIEMFSDSIQPLPPPAPTNLSATAGNEEVTLTWSSVINATEYKVYRDDVLIETTTSSTYTDHNVLNDVTYTYYVLAANQYGDSTPSDEVQATPTATPPPPPPDAPDNLTATPGKGEVTLSWDAVDEAIGYNVYVDGIKHNAAAITGTTYTVKNLEYGKNYVFYVTALNVNNIESETSIPVLSSPSEPGDAPIFSDSLPFNVTDMLKTAASFLMMYGQWILLALGVIFAPVLYSLAIRLIDAIRKRRGKEELGREKFGRREWIERERQRRAYWRSEEGKAHLDRLYREAGISKEEQLRLERQDREERNSTAAEFRRAERSERVGRENRPGRPGRLGRA